MHTHSTGFKASTGSTGVCVCLRVGDSAKGQQGGWEGTEDGAGWEEMGRGERQFRHWQWECGPSQMLVWNELCVIPRQVHGFVATVV